MKTRVYVDRNAIRDNKNGADKPVLSVRTYKGVTKCREVSMGSCRVVYSPDKPLSCGAKVWIETDEPVEVLRE